MSTAKSNARAIGYIRVSTDQQRESGLGLEAQRAAIEETAGRLHLLLTAVHVDAGLSGSLAIDDRPALADVLSTVRRGDTLIVAKWDRLARDAFLSVLIEREVAKKGVDGFAARENPLPESRPLCEIDPPLMTKASEPRTSALVPR